MQHLVPCPKFYQVTALSRSSELWLRHLAARLHPDLQARLRSRPTRCTVKHLVTVSRAFLDRASSATSKSGGATLPVVQETSDPLHGPRAQRSEPCPKAIAYASTVIPALPANPRSGTVNAALPATLCCGAANSALFAFLCSGATTRVAGPTPRFVFLQRFELYSRRGTHFTSRFCGSRPTCVAGPTAIRATLRDSSSSRVA